MKKKRELTRNGYSGVRRKIVRIMKISAFLVFVAIFEMMATGVYSQNEKVSLNVEKQTVKSVLSNIENQSDYSFFYNEGLIDVNRMVSIDVSNVSINKVLIKLFEGTGVSHQVRGKQIILSNQLEEVTNIQQDSKTITGTVTDDKGEPIPGVNVYEAASPTNGVITGLNGEFSIKVSSADAILSFSFIGFATQQASVSGKNVLNISMQSDFIGLDEVIAVGYGIQKKANLTGAVGSVDVDDAEGRAVTNAGQLIQGKVAGVSMVQNSGLPGDDSNIIRIRGISSIDNNNDPLVIIDGVVGSFNDVNPNDIESMSVLKDAASAAIYGSRASAGVILITTKNADEGLSFNYNGTASLQQATRLPNPVSSWDHAKLRNEARVNMGLPENYTNEVIELFEYGVDPQYPNTNWYDEHFQTAMMHNHFLSMRGGNERYKFATSVGYLDQEGILLGTNAEKFSFRSRLDGNFLDNKIRINFSFNGYKQDAHELMSSTSTVMSAISKMTPTTFVESANGLPSFAGRYLYVEKLGGGIDQERTLMNTQGHIEVEPLKNLTAKALYGTSRWETDYVRFAPEYYSASSVDDATTGNRKLSELNKTWSQSDNEQFTATLNYKLDIKNHKIKVLAGYERLERTYSYDQGYVEELSANEPIFSFGDPTTHSVSSRANEYSTVSQFGRFNYSFADKYLIEANIRRDGSSRFAEGEKYGFFPSFSAGWRITEEKFMDRFDFLNLKIRGSWGRLGNQNIASYYAASDQMSGSEYYAFGGELVSGRGTTVLANPETTWETTEQINAGFDAVINHRINVTLDYFYKNTYDILARVTIPPSLGVNSSPYQNIGDMRNEGLELSVGYNSKVNDNGFSYSVNANVSYLENEVTNLGDLEFVSHSSQIRSVVGESFASYFGYKADGILQVSDFTWQNNSDITIPHHQRNYVVKDGVADQSEIMDQLAPGDIKYRDISGPDGVPDGIITPDDKTIIGQSVPKYYYGFNANATYKNWSLDVIGQGVAGAESYISGPMVTPFFNAGEASISQFQANNRWTIDNPSKKYGRLYEDKVRDQITSSYNVYNASYFRLKSITLSYNVPQPVLDKIGISRLRLYTSAENILLVTDYLEGFDPERNYNRTTANFHPQTATYTFGINLSL